MDTGDGDPIASLMGGILEYLKERPRAKDTAVGVAQIWVRSPSGEYSVADVKKALDRLVADGRVRRWSSGKTEIYGAIE